jgi:uncharacterized membrane protein (UPF0182 family)
MTKAGLGGKPLMIVLLLVVLFFLPKIISFYVDWLWFSDLGFEKVFATTINGQIAATFAGGLAAFLILYVNLRIAALGTRGREDVLSLHGLGIPQLNLIHAAARIKVIFYLLLGLAVAYLFYQNWLTLYYYLHAVPFGFTDPLFGKDVSFYFFTLPMLELVSHALFMSLGTSLVLCALSYLLKASLFVDLQRRLFGAQPFARVHLSVLIAMLFLVAALGAYAEMHSLLHSARGLVAGATYTDVNAYIPALRIKMLIAIIAAVAVTANAFLRRRLVVAGSVVLYLAVSFIGSAIYPALLHKFVVAPNELVKETPYITHNINATRKAFAIDQVEERNISGDTGLTGADIKKNSATIENIRLWDHQPLLDTFSQVQEIRTYYQFVSVDNDRYMIDGQYRQTMLSPRELSTDSIPTKNWINERLTFTHGYGVTLGLVNQVTAEGLPLLMIKDIPPVSTLKGIKITRPQIYFGEIPNTYVIVNTKSKEFDYPAGEDNVFTTYAGAKGVRIDSLLKRISFSVYFGSLKLFLSNDVTKESRILYHRSIIDRIKKVMPFLVLDQDPYMVISEAGHLVWICDAYTVSNRFPYSQPYKKGMNYIRNSVKVTIDAYDGTMAFYMADGQDPVIKTISSIFPGLLKPLSEMPSDLRKHVRYPHDIFAVQAMVNSTYHMENPQSFYNREDQWEIPVMGSGRKLKAMEPYYTIMRLPGEKQEEFILMLPFNPQKKSNLSAWMVARSDGDYYGKLVLYRFPKDRLVYGPAQIVARINQDTEISRQISLWDQRGSQVIQGTLLVIPVESSLIYIQPLYLRAETGKIPELKRVIVAYENQIAMEETLDAAISKIFGDRKLAGPAKGEAVPKTTGAPAETNLRVLLKQHFDQAMKSIKEGNWARYGEEVKKLGEVIEKIQK